MSMPLVTLALYEFWPALHNVTPTFADHPRGRWNMGYTDGRENEPRKRVENHGEVPGSEHLQTMHQQEPRQTKASRTSLQHSTHALPAHRQRAPQLCARHVRAHASYFLDQQTRLITQRG